MSHMGESRYLFLTINQSWKATCSANWITLKDAEGRNSGNITITADANPSEDSRTATLVISYGGKSSYVTITQRGVPVNLSVDPDHFLIHRNGGEETVKVTSDTYWEVSTDATWITLSKYYGNGNDEVVVKVSENPYTGNGRYDIVKFKHNNTEVDVIVAQYPKLYIPFEISNVIVMNTNGGSSSSSIINMEKDGFYTSTLQYLSERITFNIKTFGTYNMTRKWYFPDSSQPDRVDTYTLPFSSYYENPFIVSIYNTYWRPEYYKKGTYKWEYYYEDELIYTKIFIVN